jgi:hypothetical protein
LLDKILGSVIISGLKLAGSPVSEDDAAVRSAAEIQGRLKLLSRFVETARLDVGTGQK